MMDAEVAERADQFARWAKKRGIFLHPDVAFAVPTRSMGCGVFARCALPAKSVILSCPAEASFSPYTSASPFCPSLKVLLADGELSRDGVLVMALFLLAERCRLASSPHKPWLALCPDMHEHLFDLTQVQAAVFALPCVSAWSSSDGVAADGTASHASDSCTEGEVPCTDPRRWTHVSQQLHEMAVARRWALAQDVMRAHEELWPRKHASFARFCNCLAQVCSRNFHREEQEGREGPYLLPGLDLLNHSFEANARLEIRGGGRKHGLCFTVVADQPVRRGAQLCINYGRIGLARYVVEFQFANAAVRQRDLVRFSTDCLVGIALALHREAAHATVHSATEEVHTRESSSSDALRLADLTMRVEQLQRLGILDDEGLYLHASPASVAWAEQERNGTEGNKEAKDTASACWTGDGVSSGVSETQWGDARRLRVVVYCLMIDQERFSELYHRHLTREWGSVPASDVVPLAAWGRAFVQKRMDAAAVQDGGVDEAFADDKCEEDKGNVGGKNAVRRGLLHDALRSEMNVLRFYLHCVLPHLT